MNAIFRCLIFQAIQMPLTSDTLPQIQQCFHVSDNIRLYTPYNSGANSLREYSKKYIDHIVTSHSSDSLLKSVERMKVLWEK